MTRGERSVQGRGEPGRARVNTHRQSLVGRWPAQSLALTLALMAAVILAGGGLAYGFWSNSDSSYPAVAEADALPQGNTPTSAVTTPNLNSNTVAIQFAQATTLNGPYAVPASNYSINRYPAAGGSATPQAATCSGTTTITCDVANVPDGFWTFTDTIVYGSNWSGLESGQSPSVTVDTAAPTATVSYPVSGSTYGANWSGTISGTANDVTSGVASVAVAIENTTTAKWWSGTAFTATTASYKAASGTSNWTYALAASKLVSGDQYSVTAQATDNVGNVGTSASSTFTYSTTLPSVAVSYPVTSTTYGANWTGSITGTASSPNTVTLVQVSIEDTTTASWWNGSAFSSSTSIYEAASGTTSWTYPLAAPNLISGHSYSVKAQAIDSLNNSATSVTATWTYNTTPPTVSVTSPVDGTTYGANWSGKLTGSATFTNTAANVTVAIENTTTGYWYNGTNFTTVTSQTFETASGTTSWTYSLGAGKLATGDSYSVVAEATDKAGNVGTSTTYAFTYSTAAPVSTVVYPASNSLTYGANWTGTISGTATFTNTASYVTVIIKNSTTSLWWDGSAFEATTSTAVSATGTTSWSYPMSAANLVSGDTYTVIAKAYDTAGNVGTSATRTFKYNTTPPTASVSYPVNTTTYGGNWTGTITGTATFTNSASSVSVAVENTSTSLWWNGTAFSATSQTFVGAAGTTSWTFALAASNFVSTDSYSVVAEATDTAGNVGTSAADAFTYNSTPPSAAVTYPVNNTSYGSNWSGTISGTASFPNGAGSVSIAIENTTTAHWWNGTNFTSATSQTFVAATGTTSWTYAIAATKFVAGDSYTVIAKATDAIGNTALSVTISFTYT